MRKAANENFSGWSRKAFSIEDIRASNLTNGDFIIQKAIIQVNGEDGDKKLTANLKFRKPGEYLMSLRSLSGIEAARFYIAGDTILINDRINKKVYHGSAGYLQEKYGISVKYLPLLLGDFIVEKDIDEFVKCDVSILKIIEKNENSDILYVLNCSRGKIISVKAVNSISGQGINIYFDKFVRSENISFPGYIKITDEREENTIEIKIEKISKTMISDMEFIPGKNYEDVFLK